MRAAPASLTCDLGSGSGARQSPPIFLQCHPLLSSTLPAGGDEHTRKGKKEKPQREHKLKRLRSDNEEIQLNCFLPFFLQAGPGENPAHLPFWTTGCDFPAGLGGSEDGAGEAETFSPPLFSFPSCSLTSAVISSLISNTRWLFSHQ